MSDDFQHSPPTLGHTLCCVPCVEAFEDKVTVTVGNAYDVIVIKSENGFFSRQDFAATFPKKVTNQHRGVLEIMNHQWPGKEPCRPSVEETSFGFDLVDSANNRGLLSRICHLLHFGRNPIRYLLLKDDQVVGVADASLFLWSSRDRVVVSDIDGTITRSNAGGIYDTILTEGYSRCHEDICKFFSEVVAEEDNTQMLYLTSRPVSLASKTRKFINNLRQQGNCLPEGPILGFGGNLAQVLAMELISRKTHLFKADLIWKNLVEPFKNAGLQQGIFRGAFGNTLMDIQAYDMVSVPLGRTYLVENSRIHAFDVEREEELVCLSNDTQTTSAPGIEMPRRWYRTKIGTVFDGYGDPKLREHLLVISTG